MVGAAGHSEFTYSVDKRVAVDLRVTLTSSISRAPRYLSHGTYEEVTKTGGCREKDHRFSSRP